jgi:hypothetical protein
VQPNLRSKPAAELRQRRHRYELLRSGVSAEERPRAPLDEDGVVLAQPMVVRPGKDPGISARDP